RLLERARDEKDRAERALAENSAKFRNDQSRSRILLPEVSAALPPESALVAFVRYQPQNLERSRAIAAFGRDMEPEYLAFVLRDGGGVPALVSLGGATKIERLISQWRKQLDQEAMASANGTNRGEVTYRRVAAELRQQIWDPLLTHVSKATRVFVVPDGALDL